MKTKPLSVFAALIAIIGISAKANAQAGHKVTLQASVPFEFIVGNRTLPSGTYTFEMATGSPKTTDQAGVLVVHNRERKLYVAVATGVVTDTNAHLAPKLTFVRTGHRVFLSTVWRQGNIAGLSVHTRSEAAPADRQESEVLTLNAVPTSGAI